MLEIEFRHVNSVAILDLSGSIDIDSSNFIENTGWCLENGYKDVLCNFANINMVDYSGLSVITIAYKNVINHKGRMKFVNVPAHVRRILCMVGLNKTFEMYESEEFAVNTFREDRIISDIQKIPLRRRFKRLPLGIDIQFKGKQEDKFHHGKVLNISAVGLLVFTEEKTYPLGEVLDIRLSLMPKPGVLEINADVVWLVEKEVQPQIYPGMGLEFYKLDPKMQEAIVEFVERNLPLTCL
jgi:anti-sigma B factor antagonist